MDRNYPEIEFTDENVSKLFGKEAAEDEDFDRLQAYYIKSRTHEKVTANLALRLLIGHKGIGKSAIFAMARHEDIANHRVSVLIRPDDISSIGKGTNDFDQMIRDWKSGMIKIITDKICENLHIPFSVSDDQHRYASYVTQFIPSLKNLLSNFLEGKGVKDTDKLIIKNFLRENRVIVYIDDLDRGWESKDEDIRRISALLNAVRDLSNDNKGLQFRISLRTDVFYLVRTSDESTDKIGDSVIWHSWTNHEILLLLIKRIQSFIGKDFDVDTNRRIPQRELAKYLEPVFEKRFTGYGKWENAPIYVILMSLIRKRPRDLVKLCNAAAKNAYDNYKTKIDTESLQNVFVTYSQDRIQDTVLEYRSELKDINRLLLNMKPSRNEIKQGRGFIYTTNELRNKIRSIIEQGTFVFKNGKRATETDLHHFLYKINFITARKRLNDGFIDRKYFEENQYLTDTTTDFGYEWEIHPAFRWVLSPSTPESIIREIELSADDK